LDWLIYLLYYYKKLEYKEEKLLEIFFL
jgi:hypothetical protein